MSFKEVVQTQRRRAITNPCQYAMQCANEGYMFMVRPAQGISCGVNLTVNVGEE
jgi:hypothetical protein